MAAESMASGWISPAAIGRKPYPGPKHSRIAGCWAMPSTGAGAPIPRGSHFGRLLADHFKPRFRLPVVKDFSAVCARLLI
jgi:hypothetical protein